MMLLWFALIGAGIIIFFWLVGKMFDAFDEQDRKFRADIEDRWYEEMDKAIKSSEGQR